MWLENVIFDSIQQQHTFQAILNLILFYAFCLTDPAAVLTTQRNITVEVHNKYFTLVIWATLVTKSYFALVYYTVYTVKTVTHITLSTKIQTFLPDAVSNAFTMSRTE